jgi:hypothetical protein
MADVIELRAFMGLLNIFKKRNWSSPLLVAVKTGLTGCELLSMLDIPLEQVEVIFINGKVFRPAEAVINPGDRVALAPPGCPGPYRVLLGFKNLAQKP